MAAPTYIGAWPTSTWVTSATPKTADTSGIPAGALLLALAAVDDPLTFGTPTASGLSFASLASIAPTSHCAIAAWDADADADATVSMSRTSGAGWWGGIVVGYSDHGGTGVR